MIILADKGSVQCEGHHRRSLSSTHFALQRGQGAKVGKRSAAPYKSSCGRHIRLAGVITHHGNGRAVTVVRVKWKTVWQTAAIAAIAALSCNVSRLPSYMPPAPEGR